MKWIETLVRRPALVTVIYLILFLFGSYSYSKLPIDLLPDMEVPVVTVVTAYPGASALDVEDKLSKPLEDSLGAIANLKEIASTSRENLSMVTLVFTSNADINVAANDVRQNLEGLKRTLPSDAESPQVLKFDFGQMPIVTFAITTPGADVRLLKNKVEDALINPLRRVPGVGSVMLSNAPDQVVRIDVHQDRLLAHGLTMSELAGLIQANNMNIPAGDLTIEDLRFSVRMTGEQKNIEALRNLPLLKSPLGEGMILLRDLADIHLDLKDETELAYVNGNTTMLGYIRKTSDANVLDVADKSNAIFEQAKQRLPEGTQIQVMESGAVFIEGTITNLTNTALTGGALVSLIVFLFLRRIGPTIIIASAIPLSIIVTFLAVYGLGFTLNSVTLIALSLSVGMVVDNGVVALENISRKIDEGMDRFQAAHEGAAEVGGALMASTTTTLVIFAPMMFISGIVGQMFAQLAVVMIVTICASLFVALTATPTLSARFIKPSGDAIREDEHAELKWWEQSYVNALTASIARPWFTLISAVGIAIVTVVLLGLLGTDFLPKDDQGQLAYTLELPVGTSKEKTLDVADVYVNALRQQPEVRLVSVRVGTSANGGMGEKEGANIARVRASLLRANDRDRSDQEIGDYILATVPRPPEVLNLEMSRDGSGAGALGATKPIVVELFGNDLEALEQASKQVQDGMHQITGLINIAADLLETQPELQINMLQNQSAQMGIPMAAAGQELRLALNGAPISRLSKDNQTYDVSLQFRKEDRSAAQSWKQVPIRSQNGMITTLGSIATQSEGEAPLQIQRKNKSRMLTISTELSGIALGDAATAVENMLSQTDLPEDVTWAIGGAIKDQRESFGDMGLLMGMGLILVYLVMVAQFESWTDPFVIMFSVPFAATGAFLALLVSGTNLSVTSFLGLIILIGVVVNNAIVLIDYIKLLRERGMELIQAIKVAGGRRLRPVLITSLTTAGGMLPLALTTGEGEQLWGPMGKTALGGLLVSSVVTLLLVPTMYVIIAKWQQRGKDNGVQGPMEPASAK